MPCTPMRWSLPTTSTPGHSMTLMRAFHDNATLKDAMIERLRQHIAADELLARLQFWEDGKGSPAGCTVHDADPLVYERELGIPRAVLPLMETLYSEGVRPLQGGAVPPWMEPSQAISCKAFPADFLEAIPRSADLSTLGTHLMLWQLTNTRYGVPSMVVNAQVRAMTAQIAAAHRDTITGTPPDKVRWTALRAQAIALRDPWPEASLSTDAIAGSVAEAAAWLERPSGRITEETLIAYLRLAEGAAASAVGWTDADDEQRQQLLDEIRGVLLAIPDSGDKAAMQAAARELVAQHQHRWQTEFPELTARQAGMAKERVQQRWRLSRACQQELLRLLRTAPLASDVLEKSS